MSWDDDDWRSRYRLCRVAFGLLAVGLALLCVSQVLFLASVFGWSGQAGRARTTPAWFWLVDAPIPWTTLTGSVLLVGLWSIPYWRRRALPLAAMNLVDAITWTLSNAGRLGLDTGRGADDYDWLVTLVTGTFGWFELGLAASLAAAVSAHLGNERASLMRQMPHLLVTVGLAFWTLFALTQTNWGAWPPHHVAPNLSGFLVFLAATGVQAVVCFQVALLCLTVSRQCREYVAVRQQHEDAGLERAAGRGFDADKPEGPDFGAGGPD